MLKIDNVERMLEEIDQEIKNENRALIETINLHTSMRTGRSTSRGRRLAYPREYAIKRMGDLIQIVLEHVEK